MERTWRASPGPDGAAGSYALVGSGRVAHTVFESVGVRVDVVSWRLRRAPPIGEAAPAAGTAAGVGGVGGACADRGACLSGGHSAGGPGAGSGARVWPPVARRGK